VRREWGLPEPGLGRGVVLVPKAEGGREEVIQGALRNRDLGPSVLNEVERDEETRGKRRKNEGRPRDWTTCDGTRKGTNLYCSKSDDG